MAVFDFEPKDGQLDEPLRSQEIIMLKEVLYVEESDRATSPVAGLHCSVHQQELVPLPSSFGSFEFQFPANHEEQNLEGQERAAPYVELPAAKRQATAPAALQEADAAASTESPLQSPFASAENIDRFLHDLPEEVVIPHHQLQQHLQQHRQHSAPPPSTLSRALLESQSQELALQHICTADQAKARVATLPTSKMLSCSNMQVSLSPVVWRDFEAPHRVMVNLGLRCLEMESDSCYPASMYAAFNPRVITTGEICCRFSENVRSSSSCHAGLTCIRLCTALCCMPSLLCKCRELATNKLVLPASGVWASIPDFTRCYWSRQYAR